MCFVNPIDEQLYLISLKNLFYFPTFWPIIFVFLAFIATQNGVLEEIKGGDAFIAISFALNILNLCLILLFTFSQCIDYFRAISPKSLQQYSKFFLRKFIKGRIEDVIVLILSLAQGFYLISLISRDLCTSCGTVFAIEKCEAHAEKNFPMNQGLLGYLSILVLTIYFKSINRHIVFLAWAILTVFIIASHIYGEYHMRFVTVMMIIFFFVSLIEYERYKMTSYLLSKEALSFEKSKLFIMQEKSKIIERKLHMALVHQILPPKVAEQIIAGKQVAPESFEEVTIFFSDVEGFTTICSQVTPAGVVQMLNDLYTVMDYCTSLFPVYKVETIGDAYMLVGGLPVRDPNHAQSIADFALLVRHAVNSVKSPVDGSSIRIRIGLHSGPVMAGVVGNLMPRYCLFGDTVNTASRMESNGQPGLIHCSEKTATKLIESGKYRVSTRGEIEVKGKGKMTTYWLDCASEDNTQSNDDAIAKCQRMVEDLLTPADSQGVSAPSLLQQAALLGSGGWENESVAPYDPMVDPQLRLQNHPQDFVLSEHDPDDDGDHKNRSGDELTTDSFGYNDTFNINSNINGNKKPMTQFKTNSDSPSRSPRQTNYSFSSNSGTTPSRANVLSATRLGLRHTGSRQNNHSNYSIFSNSNNELPQSHQSPQHSMSSHNQSINVNGANNSAISFDSTGAKILVVEDSLAQRKMLIKRLSEADASWDISAAVSGEDALAKLKAAKFGFDVVFVDENLSVSDGLFGHELVQVMRDSFNMKHTIIIACTSNPAKVGKDLIEAGVDFVWPKPPPLSSVIKTKINMLLEARLKQILAQQQQQQLGVMSSDASGMSNLPPGSVSPINCTGLSPRFPNTFSINMNFLRSFTSASFYPVQSPQQAKVHPV
jgi:class 3 adenylate cyclase/DNA-binding NarL/FixJ family response regulator